MSTGEGWHLTGEHEQPILDKLASPFQLGLVPPGKTGHLETFRGCPLSCTFCQWGDLKKTNRIFSVDYLVRELRSFQRLGMKGAMIVDAARWVVKGKRAADEKISYEAVFPSTLGKKSE